MFECDRLQTWWLKKSSDNGMTLTHVYIIVPVVFGVAFLIAIIAAIVYCYKKRRRQGSRKCDNVLRVRFVAKPVGEDKFTGSAGRNSPSGVHAISQIWHSAFQRRIPVSQKVYFR